MKTGCKHFAQSICDLGSRSAIVVDLLLGAVGGSDLILLGDMTRGHPEQNPLRHTAGSESLWPRSQGHVAGCKPVFPHTWL